MSTTASPRTVDGIRKALDQALPRTDAATLTVSARPEARGKLELTVANGRRRLRLTVQWTTNPQRSRIHELREKPTVEVVLVAPHIPDGLAQDLRSWGINHADLNGRLYVAAEGLLIDREPKGLTYRNPTSGASLYTPKATRILRALLSSRDPGREWTQAELKSVTGASPGYVSRLLTALEEDGYVACLSEGGGGRSGRYRLAEFDRLLDGWVTADLFRDRVEVTEYSVLKSDPIDIAKAVAAAFDQESIVFTQWIAAWLRRPHTTPPVVSAYVRGVSLPAVSLGREVSSGGNLWLLRPRDEGVFQCTQAVNGLPLVCDPQIYLDLITAGLRGPEAAQALREWEGFAR